VKYYQKCVKFACNYFINSSAFGGLRPQTPYRGSAPRPRWGLPSPRPPVVLPPSQTSFRRLWYGDNGNNCAVMNNLVPIMTTINNRLLLTFCFFLIDYEYCFASHFVVFFFCFNSLENYCTK